MSNQSAAAAEVADYESALRTNGTDPTNLLAWAKMLTDFPDAEFTVSLSAWQSEADSEAYRSAMAGDYDFGSVILEALADGADDPTKKRRLYEAACRRAEGYAADATSGGEGMARMIRVRRIQQKLRALR